MPYAAVVNAAIWRELPRDEHDGARAALETLARLDRALHSAQVSILDDSPLENSYRLRFGRYRILFILFPDERTLVFTTAFLKRRDADYGPAIVRHDSRVRSYE